MEHVEQETAAAPLLDPSPTMPSSTEPPAPEPSIPDAPARLWSSKRYVAWLISDTAKGVAGTLLNFAIPLLVLMVTNDPAQAGIIGGVGMAVQLLCTFAGGVLADRHSRIRMMVAGGCVGAILSAGFAALAWTGSLTFGWLLVIEVLLAIRGGIFNSAGEAQLKTVVPPSVMGRAQAANQARDAALQIAGNPIGGFLLAIGGWVIGAVMCVAHALSAGFAAVLGKMGDLNSEPASQPPAPSKANGFREIREAFGWLFSRQDLRGVLLISTAINLGLNAAITTAIYVLQQAGHAPAEISLVSSAIGIAMLVGAFFAPFLVQRVGAGMLTILGLVLLSSGVAGLTAIDSILGIAFLLGVSSLLTPALNSGIMGYFMVAVPSEMMGRASSALQILVMGAMPLAPLVAGFGLAYFGRTATILLCVGLCVGAAAMAALSRSVRAIPKESEWVGYAERFA